MAWQKTRIEIPEDIAPDERKAIAESILERIRERAINEGRGINPDTRRLNKFPPYTKEYAKKKGVSRGSVDLTLSAEMLTDMRLLSDQKGSLLIGFENGTKLNGKAEGNQTGSYGGSPKASRARHFLGISVAELTEILKKHGFKK